MEPRNLLAVLEPTIFSDVVDPDDGELSLREAVILANETAESDTILLGEGTFELELDGPESFEVNEPIARNDRAVFQLNTNENLVDVLANDVLSNLGPTRITGDVELLSEPPTGSEVELVETPDGQRVSYTPASGFLGTDRIQYTLQDGAGNVSTATVEVIVQEEPVVVALASNPSRSGDLDIFQSLEIIGAGSGLTFIDANGTSRVFDVGGSFGDVDVGAISDDDEQNGFRTNLSITGVSIGNGTVANGGGAIRFAGSGELTLEDVELTNNTSFDAGGAISFLGSRSLNISRTSIVGNTSERDGGGIHYLSDFGGLMLSRSSVVNNSAVGNGGGAFIEGPDGGTIVNTTFSQNVAGESVDDQDIDRGNQMAYEELTTLLVDHSTFVNRDSDTNRLAIAGDDAALDVSNSIIIGQLQNNGLAAFESTIAFPGSPSPISTPGVIFTDPNLEPLVFHDGVVSTHTLKASSAAVDAAVNSAVDVDARGLPRPVAAERGGPAIADIGAVELQRTEINAQPVAFDDQYFVTIEADAPTASISIAQDSLVQHLLANDDAGFDPTGGTLATPSFVDLQPVGSVGGTLVLNGQLATYRPASLVEQETFVYTITDGEFETAGLLQIRRAIVESNDRIDFGRNLTSLAVSPRVESDGFDVDFQVATVSDLDNRLYIVDLEYNLLFPDLRLDQPDSLREVVLSERPRSLAYNSDGTIIAVAAPGFGQSRGNVFVIENGVLTKTLDADFSPVDVTVGDFSGDGVEDYASANFRSGVIGFNDGISDAFVTIDTMRDNPQHIETADFDSNGKLDLIVYYRGVPDGDSPQLTLYLQDDDGFASPITIDADSRVIDMDIVTLSGQDQPTVMATDENGSIRTYRLSGGNLRSEVILNTDGQLRGASLSGPYLSVVNTTSQTMAIYESDDLGNYELVGRKPLATPRDVAAIPRVGYSIPLFASASLFADPDIEQFRYPGSLQVTGLLRGDESIDESDLAFFSIPVQERPAGGGGTLVASGDVVPAEGEYVYDVNADRRISPLDALTVINRLSHSQFTTEEGEQSSEASLHERCDVNQDGRVSPLDALLIINQLNRSATSIHEGEQLLAAIVREEIENKDRVFAVSGLLF